MRQRLVTEVGDLKVCPTCHAVVPEIFLWDHEKWHRTLVTKEVTR